MVRAAHCTLLVVVAVFVMTAPGLARPDVDGVDAADAADAVDRAAASDAQRRGRTAPRVIDGRRVLAISLDGLNPAALRRLGRARTPALHRLLREGAGTLNARAQVEQTVTLPNHTSMVTGRRIDAAHRGHGVTWNVDIPHTTVQGAAGHPVSSVFSVVRRAGGRTAVFATKSKFSLFERSWPTAVGRTVVRTGRDAALVRALRRDLVRHDRAFTFAHLGLVDQVGHVRGWMSAAYLRAVRRVDGLVGSLLRTIRAHASLDPVVVVLTADHGGTPGTRGHSDPRRLANHRVPFVIWGPGVDHGDLYELNPSYADPGRRRPGFRGTQPIRNGDLANLATDLLGLGPVPSSRWDRRQTLRWSRQAQSWPSRRSSASSTVPS